MSEGANEVVEEPLKADLSLDEIVAKVRAALLPEISELKARVEAIEDELKTYK